MSEARTLWKVSRPDLLAFVTAFIATLLLGIEESILVACGLEVAPGIAVVRFDAQLYCATTAVFQVRIAAVCYQWPPPMELAVALHSSPLTVATCISRTSFWKWHSRSKTRCKPRMTLRRHWRSASIRCEPSHTSARRRAASLG